MLIDLNILVTRMLFLISMHTFSLKKLNLFIEDVFLFQKRTSFFYDNPFPTEFHSSSFLLLSMMQTGVRQLVSDLNKTLDSGYLFHHSSL